MINYINTSFFGRQVWWTSSHGPAWFGADQRRGAFRTKQIIIGYRWLYPYEIQNYMAVCQNLVPLVNLKIACKWMFNPLKMVLIGIDPYPYLDPRWLNIG
jgi:hypothetical protein